MIELMPELSQAPSRWYSARSEGRDGDWIERRGGRIGERDEKRDAGLGSNKYECIKAGKPRSIIMQYAMHMQHVQA